VGDVEGGAVGAGSAKLILFGEHAAVHGHPAVGAQLPEKTTVRIGPPGDGPWDVSTAPPEDREGLLRLLARLESVLPELCSDGRGMVSVESAVLRGVGMGSSAALCVALARAALARTSLGRSGALDEPALAWRISHELEKLFHGAPSGIDTGLSLQEGVSAFYPRAPELPRVQAVDCAPLLLVVAAVPRSGRTSELVGRIGERMRSGDIATRESLQRLGGIAREAIEALGAGSGAGAAAGTLADEAMRELRALGLSSPALDLLLEQGARAGALGGKLSGAGGGGAFFLVAADAEKAAVIRARVTDAAGQAGISLASPPRVIGMHSQP